MLLGWIEHVGPSRGLTNNVLVNRLRLTGVQLLGFDEDETLPGQSAASVAMVVAADALSAHLHFQDGDVEGVRRALGRAEAAVIEVLQNLYGLRIPIGDAEAVEE